jgi:hypothetical protein
MIRLPEIRMTMSVMLKIGWASEKKHLIAPRIINHHDFKEIVFVQLTVAKCVVHSQLATSRHEYVCEEEEGEATKTPSVTGIKHFILWLFAERRKKN